MRFDLVIFDCDGVLIDSELLSVQADRACLAEYGIDLTADEIIERYTGISMAGMLADLEAEYGRPLPDFAHRHRQRLRPLFEAKLRAIPGVTAIGFTGAAHCRPGHGARLADAGAAQVIDRMARLTPVLTCRWP
jgi:phosphoglycolate phosphatase-like HAD superfamily hydrolase